MLEPKESLSTLAATLGQSLIEDGNNEGASGDFEQADQKHGKRCQCKRFPVRLDVFEQSLKIAHRQFGESVANNSG
jgi:hypothetical protein